MGYETNTQTERLNFETAGVERLSAAAAKLNEVEAALRAGGAARAEQAAENERYAASEKEIAAAAAVAAARVAELEASLNAAAAAKRPGNYTADELNDLKTAASLLGEIQDDARRAAEAQAAAAARAADFAAQLSRAANTSQALEQLAARSARIAEGLRGGSEAAEDLTEDLARLTKEERRVVVKVLGAAELDALNRKLYEERAALVDLKRQLDANAIGQAAFDSAVAASASKMVGLGNQIKALKTSTGDYRQNLMGLSYALNDFFSVQGNFQQRLNSVANNMPMLLEGVGGLGLALSALLPVLGALSTAAPAVWKSFFGEDYQSAKAAVEELRKKVQAWEQSPPKLPLDASAFEAARVKLEELEGAAAAFERTRKTAEMLDVASRASKAVTNTVGSEELVGSVLQARAAAGVSFGNANDEAAIKAARAMLPQLQAAVDRPRRGAEQGEVLGNINALASLKDRIEKLDQSIRAANVESAKNLVGGFAQGNFPAIAQIQGMMKANPGAFDKDFRDEAITLPNSKAELKAARDDLLARDRAAEQAERDKAADLGIRKAEAKDDDFLKNRAEAAERLKAEVNAAIKAIQDAAGPAILKAVREGLVKGEGEAALLKRVTDVAAPAGLREGVRPAVNMDAAQRAAMDAIKAEKERINPEGKGEPARPVKPGRGETVKERTERVRQENQAARTAAEAKRTAAAKAKTEARAAAAQAKKDDLAAGVFRRPGARPKPKAPAPTRLQAGAAEALRRDEAARLKAAADEAQAAVPEALAPLQAFDNLQQFIATSNQTISALTDGMAQLDALFAAGAASQQRLRRNAVEQIRAQQTRTREQLGGIN